MKKCKYCEKEFDTQGKLNLHQYHCMIKHVKVEQAGENVSRETEECKHVFRLLNGTIPLENRAIQNGYMEVCKKCQTVQ